MKRRRVDLSLRVQEAKDTAFALEEWLDWATGAGEAEGASRVRRVLVRLRRGIEYVIEVNPSHRPNGARTRRQV